MHKVIAWLPSQILYTLCLSYKHYGTAYSHSFIIHDSITNSFQQCVQCVASQSVYHPWLSCRLFIAACAVSDFSTRPVFIRSLGRQNKHAVEPCGPLELSEKSYLKKLTQLCRWGHIVPLVSQERALLTRTLPGSKLYPLGCKQRFVRTRVSLVLTGRS